MSSDTSDAGSDPVLIDRDDISNYNPSHILPESPETIDSIRQWLQPTSYEDRFGEYQKHLDSHAAGTGTWLTSSTTYCEWLQSPQLGTLWVKGIPGSGKSVIAAQLIHELATQHPGTPVLYFFFRQIIDANHEPTALLRDWLDQVLIYSPPLQRCLKEYVKASRPLDSLSTDDLWRDLRLALGGLPNNAYCVVDALDEMDHGHNDFLQTLAELGLWKPEKVKLLMTSRPIARLDAVLRKAETLQIRLDETAVDKDISTFVQQKLSDTSITDSDRELILDAVPGRANGLFLYARLAMDAFLKPGADIRDVLKTLPLDLNNMYMDLLRVHSLRSGIPYGLQRLILQFATHASRPLRLLEVAEMLELTSLSRTEKDLKATKDMVRAACGPLLEILPDETVCVVHHSFTEYLIGATRPDTHTGYPALEPGPTHNTLALVCLSYLESGCLSHVEVKSQETEGLYILSQYYETPSPDVERRLKYPFFEYAASNWHVHITKSMLTGYNQEEVNKALEQFFSSDERLKALLFLSWPWPRLNLSGLNQLHVAARLGLEHYVKELLKKGNIDVDSPDEMGRTPLWWAASSGHAGVVRLLAQAGANPDEDESYNGYKPLHEAARANHVEVVKVLMEFGVSPMTGKTRDSPGMRCGNEPSSRGHTPLMYACQYGHVEVVDVFLSFMSDPNIVCHALVWAAKKGRAAIVRRILQHPNADANTKGYSASPLALACSSGNPDTVLALLEAGADPNIIPMRGAEIRPLLDLRPRSDDDYSPLRRLCRASGESRVNYDSLQTIFSLLVGAGANVHERGVDGSNALHWAINSPILTRLLLDAGVDANVASADGATPLHKARNVEVMCLLITSGNADINRKDREGKTPLLSRLANRDLDPTNLHLFLEFGPDCSIVDNKGNNVIYYLLRYASSTDRTTTLQQLLAMGADPNYRNSLSDLPWHNIRYDLVAVDQILDLLLAAGIDLNSQDKGGATILFRAIRDQPHTVALDFLKRLISKGASLAIRDFRGRTLLHEAIKTWPRHSGNGRAAWFELLMAHGLDFGTVDNHGNNLLHELAMCSYHGGRENETVLGLWKKLLSLGLDPSQRNCTGRTPLHILCSSKSHLSSLKALTVLPIDIVISKMKSSGSMTIDVADNAGITPLHLASTTSGIYVQKLLDAEADPTRATMEGRTPLHLAAQSRESNIVGILLDALYKHHMIVDLPVGDIVGNTAAILPRGSWYRRKTLQLSPEVIDAKDTFSLNLGREFGWAPLNYACRSGRPETVALLLQTNAKVSLDSLIEACFGFEQEQSLWDKDHQVGEDLDTGGLLLADSSRPSIVEQYAPKLNNRTARIDEILEMLLGKNVQFNLFGGADQWYYYYLVKEAFNYRRDYTVGCLTTAIGQQSTGPDSYAMHQRCHVQETARRSLIDFEGFKKGEVNRDLFESFMMRRDYDMVRELSRAGADFFKQGSSSSLSSFEVLVSLGFASLAKGVVDDFNADLKGSGEEEIQQAPGRSSQSNATFGSHNKSDRFRDAPYLLLAVRRALPNMEMVRFLVEDCGVDLDKLHREQHGNGTESPLLSVAKGAQWWHAALAVPYFIERSADLNVRNHDGQTPLHVALDANHRVSCGLFCEDIVRALLKAGADVNAVDAQGRNCLAYAGRDAALVRLLFENGAKADASALFSAIDENNLEVLEAVLSAGVDPNIRRPTIESPPTSERNCLAVHLAARADQIRGWHNLGTEEQAILEIVRTKIVEMLLAHGADPFATFIQPQRFNYNPEDSEDSIVSVLYFSISPHRQLHVPDGYIESSILHDLIKDSISVEPFLKLADLDVDRRDPHQGETLLLSACSSGKGPDTLIEISLPDIENPFIANQSILRYLLSRGADPLVSDNQGRNALHKIFEGVVRNLYRQPKFHDSLSYITSTYPTLINQKDKLGRTPLHLALQLVAVTDENIAAVTMLLKAGADPLLTDGDGNSSLHIMSCHLYTGELRDLFRDLLRRGCAINGRNIHGQTPLFSSMFGNVVPDPDGGWNDLQQMALWKESGADFGTRDNTGRGLLHIAARGDPARFQELMQAGLDPMMDDENKQTPLDVAAACDNKDVLALFARKQ